MRFNIVESVGADFLVGANAETFTAAGFALRQSDKVYERQIPVVGSADFLRTRLSADLPKPDLFVEVVHKLVRTKKNVVGASVVRGLDGPRLPEPAWRRQFEREGFAYSLIGFRTQIRGLAGFYVTEAEVSDTGIGITVFRVKPVVLEAKVVCTPTEVASISFELDILGLARQRKFGELIKTLEFEVPADIRQKFSADIVAVFGLAVGNCERCAEGPHIHPVRPIERLLAGAPGEKATEPPAEKSAPALAPQKRPAPASATPPIGRPAAKPASTQAGSEPAAAPPAGTAPKPMPGKPAASTNRRDTRNDHRRPSSRSREGQELHNKIVDGIKWFFGDRFVPEIHALADAVAAEVTEENTVEKLVKSLDRNPFKELDDRGIPYRMRLPEREKIMLHLARLLAIPHGTGIYEEVEAHLDEGIYADLQKRTEEHEGDFYPVAQELKKEGCRAFCKRHSIPPPPPEVHNTDRVRKPSNDFSRQIVRRLLETFPLAEENAEFLAPFVFVLGRSTMPGAWNFLGRVKRFRELVEACLNQTVITLSSYDREFLQELAAFIEPPVAPPQEVPVEETLPTEPEPASAPEVATDEVVAEGSTTTDIEAADAAVPAPPTAEEVMAGGGRASLPLSAWLEPLRNSNAVTAAEIKMAGKAFKGKKAPKNVEVMVSKSVPRDVAEKILSLLAKASATPAPTPPEAPAVFDIEAVSREVLGTGLDITSADEQSAPAGSEPAAETGDEASAS